MSDLKAPEPGVDAEVYLAYVKSYLIDRGRLDDSARDILCTDSNRFFGCALRERTSQEKRNVEISSLVFGQASGRLLAEAGGHGSCGSRGDGGGVGVDGDSRVCDDSHEVGGDVCTSKKERFGISDAAVDSKKDGVHEVGGLKRDGDGDSCFVVSEKTLRNRQWRADKKRRRDAKKARSGGGAAASTSWLDDRDSGGDSGVDADGRLEGLSMSLQKKWKTENDLAAAKAERELALLRASSLEDQIRNRRTKLTRQTEANMVAIEQSYSKLAVSGNVSSEMQIDHDNLFSGSSRVHTVVESGVASGTISPNSSVSEQEVRKLQKDYEDLVKEREEWLQWKAGATNVLKGVGFNADNAPFAVKKDWTLDGNGELSSEYRRVLNEMYEDDWAMTEYGSDYKLRYPEGKNMCRIHVIDQA